MIESAAAFALWMFGISIVAAVILPFAVFLLILWMGRNDK